MPLLNPLIRLLCLALLLGFCTPLQVAAQVTTPRTCGKVALYDAATSGASQLVPTATDRYVGNEIFICGYAIASAQTVVVSFVYGTGTNCATGQVTITPGWRFTAPTSGGFYSIVDGQATWRGLSVPAGNSLCINVSSGLSVQAIVYYDNNPL